MPTEPAVRAIRRETVIVGASAVLSFFIVEYVNTTFIQLQGAWRYALWFGLGMVLIVVLVTLFTLAAQALLGPEKE